MTTQRPTIEHGLSLSLRNKDLPYTRPGVLQLRGPIISLDARERERRNNGKKDQRRKSRPILLRGHEDVACFFREVACRMHLIWLDGRGMMRHGMIICCAGGACAAAFAWLMALPLVASVSPTPRQINRQPRCNWNCSVRRRLSGLFCSFGVFLQSCIRCFFLMGLPLCESPNHGFGPSSRTTNGMDASYRP